MLEKQYQYLEDEYTDIENIVKHTVGPGGNVVEMFAWVLPHIATITKSVTGIDSNYYSISNYNNGEYFELFRNFMNLNFNYKENIIASDSAFSALIIKNRKEQLGEFREKLEKTFSKYQANLIELEETNSDCRTNSVEITREFFNNIGITPIIHTMPPLLPDGIADSIDLVIENWGIAYAWENARKILDSAVDRLKLGGHLVLREDEKTINRIIPMYQNNQDVSIVSMNLKNPHNYLLLQKHL